MPGLGNDDEAGARNLCASSEAPGSRQGSSSSPVTMSVGTVSFFMLSTRSQSEGRRICTPRIVLTEPLTECSASCAANSRQPRGSLFWYCTRAAPTAYFAANGPLPCSSRSLAVASHSPRNTSRSAGLGAVAAAAHHERARKCCVPEAEMKRGEAAHGEPDHMGLLDAEMLEYRGDVVGGARLRVARHFRRNVGRGIAARVVGYCAIAVREKAHLGLPAAMVARILVHEDDGGAAPRLLVIQLHAIIRQRVGHASSPWFERSLRPAKPAFRRARALCRFDRVEARVRRSSSDACRRGMPRELSLRRARASSSTPAWGREDGPTSRPRHQPQGAERPGLKALQCCPPRGRPARSRC